MEIRSVKSSTPFQAKSGVIPKKHFSFKRFLFSVGEIFDEFVWSVKPEIKKVNKK